MSIYIMKNEFPDSSKFGEKKSVINPENIEKLIKAFNKVMKKNTSSDFFSINDGLDKLSFKLSDAELKSAKIMAMQKGWNLERISDNYNTTTYTLKKFAL